MAKKKSGSGAAVHPLPLRDGVAQLHAVRNTAMAARLVEVLKPLPQKLRSVVKTSFTQFGSVFIGALSEEILKLSRAERKSVFAAFFPEYPDAMLAAFEDVAAFPIRHVLPFRAPDRPKEHLLCRLGWWEAMALTRLEFPTQSFSAEAFAGWAAYCDLGVDEERQNAAGRLFAKIIDAGGAEGEALSRLLKSAFDPKSPRVLPGGHVFVGLWGSADAEAHRLLGQALLDKRFAAHRTAIFTAASLIRPQQLVALAPAVVAGGLLRDKAFLERFLEVTALGRVFEILAASKAEREESLAYLATKSGAKSPKAIPWIDAWWEAWQTTLSDVDAAVPVLSSMTSSSDRKISLAGMALAKEAGVAPRLAPVVLLADRNESLGDALGRLQTLANIKTKLPDAKRKERLVEMAQLYERAIADAPARKKLGNLKARELLDRIIGQWRTYWKDEPFTLIAAAYQARPFELNRIVPEKYVVPDQATATFLIDSIRLDKDVESLYEDTFSTHNRIIDALHRSVLAPDVWIHFLRHIHGEWMPLPPAVVDRFVGLPKDTILLVIETLLADKSSSHRAAGWKLALAVGKGKMKALDAMLKQKLATVDKTVAGEEKGLRATFAK